MFHTAGQFAGESRHESPQPSHAHEFRIALGSHFGTNPVKVTVEIQILLYAQVFIEAEFLRHVANPRLNFLGMSGDINAQGGDRARIGKEQPSRQANQGGLAGAVGTHQPGNTPAFYVERYVLESARAAAASQGKRLGDVLVDKHPIQVIFDPATFINGADFMRHRGLPRRFCPARRHLVRAAP